MRKLGKVAPAILGVAVVVEALDMVVTTAAVRSRNPRALNLVKRMHKLTNPRLVRLAGRSGSQLATVHHVGRRSGLPYATPVMAHRCHDDVIIPLPYGTDVDWLRNIQSAGRTDVDLDGQTFTVDRPVVVDSPTESVTPLLYGRDGGVTWTRKPRHGSTSTTHK